MTVELLCATITLLKKKKASINPFHHCHSLSNPIIYTHRDPKYFRVYFDNSKLEHS